MYFSKSFEDKKKESKITYAFQMQMQRRWKTHSETCYRNNGLLVLV